MGLLESALDSKFHLLVHLGIGLSGFVNKFKTEAEMLDGLVSYVC